MSTAVALIAVGVACLIGIRSANRDTFFRRLWYRLRFFFDWTWKVLNGVDMKGERAALRDAHIEAMEIELGWRKPVEIERR